MLSSLSNGQSTDFKLLRQINLNRNQKLDNAFINLSHSALPVSAAYPLAVLGVGIAKGDKEIKWMALEAGLGIGGAMAATVILKYSLKRNRPFVSHPELQNLSSPTDPSFPSGHSSSVFATATMMSLHCKKWYVVVPAYTYAGLVAYSRLHLGVHYPTDVLVGSLLGSACAYITHKVYVKWNASRSKAIPVQ
jgi:membrane-associated phospholipid phosphatase